MKDTDTMINPESRGRTTRNMRVQQQSDLMINILQWNFNKVFTEEETLQLRTKDKSHQVSLVKYQES